MKRIILLITILLIAVGSSLAQFPNSFTKGSEFCSYRKSNLPYTPLLTGDSPGVPRHSYDVLNYQINIDIRNCFISPYPKSFSGYVIITFRIDSTLNFINLNAVNTSIQVNSVGLNGTGFTHTNNILTVTLNRTYSPGETAQVRVNYQHLNVTDNAIYTGNGGFFTDAEPEGARKWFPCWDKPSDKATVDITMKVPANVRIGSNGRLNDSLVTGDTIYYHWISRDPVATYLVVMTGKVNYGLDIVYWRKLSNPSDSIPIRFYYNSGENPAVIKNLIGNMTTYYSQRFGEHGFEKNGFTTAPAPGFSWGGMENQTLTTLCSNCWTENLVSHEYAHQWYGDMITCGTWGDIWLNEGFATYIEAAWFEKTGGYTAYKNDINSSASSYLSGNPGWAMYRPDWINNTPPTNQLFNYAITYAKGACVLHMLRYVVNDTAVFFNLIRSYAMDTTNFKHKSAVTDDFATKISQVYGQDLTWFIDQWVKQPNHPVYQNYYSFTNLGGGNWSVGFQANQTQTNSPFHRMPLVLRIIFTTGPDTNIRVENTFNNQFWFWTFNRQPSGFTFDPNNDIVLKQGTTSQGQVGIGITGNNIPDVYSLHQNYPNPFNPVTTISFDLPRQSSVTLIVFDLSGKVVYETNGNDLPPGQYSLNFNGSNLSSGVYFYKLSAISGVFKFIDTRRMVVVK